MKSPSISVIVPVHNSNRPIYRAVKSLLASGPEIIHKDLEVLVVCHEVSPLAIENNLGELLKSPAVSLLEFKDGVGSPAGPMNHGIRQAKGEWILILGSDDYLEPNFLKAYLHIISSRPELDAVLLPISLSNGSQYFASPVPQYGFRKNLETIRDRLFYRTAPAALVRKQLILGEHSELYTEGIRNGEDLIHSTWLWTHAMGIYLNRSLPHYIVGDDATDRVTSMTYSPEELKKPLELLTSKNWFASLSARTRNAFGIKYFRSNIISRDWEGLDHESKAALVEELIHLDLHCNLDKKSLSITENIKLRKILSYPKADHYSSWWEKIDILQRLAAIFPVSASRAFSPNSWLTISRDIILGNLLWFRKN